MTVPDEQQVVKRSIRFPFRRVHVVDDVTDDVRALQQVEVAAGSGDRRLNGRPIVAAGSHAPQLNYIEPRSEVGLLEPL